MDGAVFFKKTLNECFCFALTCLCYDGKPLRAHLVNQTEIHLLCFGTHFTGDLIDRDFEDR